MNQRVYKNQCQSQAKDQVDFEGPGGHFTGSTERTAHANQAVPSDEGYSSITFVLSEIGFAAEEEIKYTDDEEQVEEEAADEEWNEEEEEEEEEGVLGSDSDWEEDDDPDSDSTSTNPPHLCPECGTFYDAARTHTCIYKLKPYSCIDCGMRCANERSLQRHSVIHRDTYEHLCKFCFASFKTKRNRLAHEATHSAEENPYKCPDCSTTFAKLKLRNLHRKTHSKSKQLTCPICNMQFHCSSQLSRHTVVHTGVKPFVCDVCDRSFNQAGHLKSHMRLHTGERPFQCQDCDQSFNHKVSLKSHVMRYHSQVYGSGQDGHVEETKMKPPKVKKDDMNEKKSNTGDVEKKGGAPAFDRLAELERRRIARSKYKKPTGRPRGRPKRNAGVTDANLVLDLQEKTLGPNEAGETFEMDRLERIVCKDDDSRRKDGDLTLDIKEGEEETFASKRKARGTPTWEKEVMVYDSDSDFDPAEEKRRRKSGVRRNLNSNGKPRGRTKNPVL